MIVLEHLQVEAGVHDWTQIDYQHNIGMVSFRNSHNIRINIYLTTGTVAICIPKKKQQFARNRSLEAIIEMFIEFNKHGKQAKLNLS